MLTTNGFRWWADKYAQTIEVIGEEEGPDGMTGYHISVRTDFLRALELNDHSLKTINTLLMPFASMAGPVYDPATRALSLCSLFRVYEELGAWMNHFISDAALLQIGEVRIMSAEMAKLLYAEQAISGHPQRGERLEPDEMAEAISAFFAPMGKQPCRWPVAEFKSAVEQYMQQPPSLMATAGGMGFTVEFPYGDESSISSILRVKGDQPHPRYGNGLSCLQSFPIVGLSDYEGARLALTLNGIDLSQKPTGYGLGSYYYRDNTIHFVSFFPNTLYAPGLLPNIYFASTERAREMSVRLTKCDWTPESFSPRRSALGRMMDRLRRR
ncbi:MAG: hypothetical protein ABIG43_03485 [Chloroflexota bacterium]